MAKALCLSPSLANWASATNIIIPYRFEAEGAHINIGIEATGGRSYRAHTSEGELLITINARDNHTAQLIIDSKTTHIQFHFPATAPRLNRIAFSMEGRDYDLVNLNAVFAHTSETVGAGKITAPMHGMLVSLFAKHGVRVKKGDPLAILEAMKMQHELTADIDGVISAVNVTSGEQVSAGSLIIEITDEETS